MEQPRRTPLQPKPSNASKVVPVAGCVPQFEISPSTPVQCCGMGCESPRDRLIREATVAAVVVEYPDSVLRAIVDHANELYPQE